MSAPHSTYRLQFGPHFTFADATELVKYLATLGVDAVYASPLLAAMPGSEHGYDVADPSRVSEALGGEAGRRRLVDALRRAGMRLVVDIVPNHLGVRVPQANPAWWDRLRHGTASAYARWFDTTGALLRIPVRSHQDEAPAEGVTVHDGMLRYREHEYPLAPGTSTLDEQHYELVAWDADINYRRFFAVSELAGVRVEDPEVFAATHDLVLQWVAAGEVDGIRVDHPDGLADPLAYLRRLRAAAPDAWLIAEKILEPGERLPDSWPVAGTTGYDALAELDGVFVDPDAAAELTDLDIALTGELTEWHQLVRDCKLEVISGMLRSELHRLASLAPDVPDASAALAELLASFAVYRTYLPEGVERLRAALTRASRAAPHLGASFETLRARLVDPADELAVRVQQTSSAVMAKAVEDTACYRYTRFVAANEVGGDPGRIGLPVDAFHDAMALREQRTPGSMTTLSTHDTKRSVDVRARLAVLAELPQRWADAVSRFEQLAPTPDGALGHLLWQTVVGAWPIERDRLHAYLQKAMREAGTVTSWHAPDARFEALMHANADAVYDNRTLRELVTEFVEDITPHGWSNSLGETLLQLAGPGVPDTYQGCELWDYSLVDPDNRRQVDFALRRRLLTKIDTGWLPPIDSTGAAKLLLVSRVLRLRRDNPERFSGYTPLTGIGPAADHVVAFARRGMIAVATRLPVRLAAGGGWRDTTLPLPAGHWHDTVTGAYHDGGAAEAKTGAIRLADLFARYPVALLVANSSSEPVAVP